MSEARRCFGSLPAAALLLAATFATACPTALPAGLRGESVGDSMVVNGLPLTVMQVTGKETAADMLARVEKDWKDADYDVRRQRTGAWDVIAARSADCNTTLQLMDSGERGGSFGYLGVGNPARSSEWLPRRLGVTLPGSITLNSTVASTDGGRSGTTIAFSTKRGVGDINDYFLTHLNRTGWEAVNSQELRASGSNRARVVSAQKGREQISIVLWQDGFTRALINLSEAL